MGARLTYLEWTVATSPRRSHRADDLTDYKESLSGAIAGTPEQCIQQLSRYVDRGIRYFFLLFPNPISSGSLKLFASEGMSHFAMSTDKSRQPGD